MALEKLILVACSVLPAGALAIGGGALIGQFPGSKNGLSPPRPGIRHPGRLIPPVPDRPLPGKIRGAAARGLGANLMGGIPFQSEWKKYRRGAYRVGALLKAVAELKLFEQNAVEGRLVELAERHLKRLKDIEAFEQTRSRPAGATRRAGSGAARRGAAKLGVKVAREFKQPTLPDLVEAARHRLDAQRAYYEEGRITLDRFIAASQRLMDAERQAAKTKAERLAALERHVNRLKEVENRERAELIVGKGTEGDVAEAVESRVEAEIRLKDETTAGPRAEIEALTAG